MQVFEEAAPLQSQIEMLRSDGKSIGFVPTMGALHRGHLSLVSRAVRENDYCVCSIFVNPTQFNNSEDLKRYPRLPEKDLHLLKGVNCHFVFMPEVKVVYPESVSSDPIFLNGLDRHMEGEFRPGHFQGVATVVRRFFELVKPHKAYFGEKDFQQLQVIRHMTQHLHLDVEIIGHPVERNAEGLALSSRNKLLSEVEKHQASAIYHILSWAQQNYQNFTPDELKEEVEVQLRNSPLLLEYVEISDPDTLQPIEDWNTAQHARIFLAAFLGKVRLIDNLSLF